MAADTPDTAYGITGERNYYVHDIAESKLVAFVDYKIDGVDTLDQECRKQVYVAIQYQLNSGRWVDAWNELEAEAEMMMTDGTTEFYEPKMFEVDKTDSFIAFWLNLNQTRYIDDVKYNLAKTGANITVNMRVGWFDASKKSIGPLEQTFLLNFITPYTETVQAHPCADAVAVLMG
jgi:hypothetical protein